MSNPNSAQQMAKDPASVEQIKGAHRKHKNAHQKIGEPQIPHQKCCVGTSDARLEKQHQQIAENGQQNDEKGGHGEDENGGQRKLLGKGVVVVADVVVVLEVLAEVAELLFLHFLRIIHHFSALTSVQLLRLQLALKGVGNIYKMK